MTYENLKYIFLIIAFIPFETKGIDNPKPLNDNLNYKIIISEIMADPTPANELPPFEYIEIYNQSGHDVNLFDWQLHVGTYIKSLPYSILSSNEYMIICDKKADSLFKFFGKTLALDHFPPILNSGQTITLISPEKEIVHSITFSDKWYKNPEKRNGGWSLEMIDPANPCNGSSNWSESLDASGGSPGNNNSVRSLNPDTQNPFLLRATIAGTSSVELYFSEPLKASTLENIYNYSVSPELLHPHYIDLIEPDFNKIILNYDQKVNPGIIYTVTVANNIEDCAGNFISGKTFCDFAISQLPFPSDIVINEILFYTDDKTSEFIELYNRSDKIIDLSVLNISLADYNNYSIKKTVSLRNFPCILFPGKYVCLTASAPNLPDNNFYKHPGSILEAPFLFELPDEEGFIVLTDTLNQTIDEMRYNRMMQSEFIQNSKNVSLEKINPEYPSNDPENWQSSSTSVKFSTPGYANSQMNYQDNFKIVLSSESFSPDNDGFEDKITIHLITDEPGWMGSLSVFNMNGALIKPLASNYLLGSNEFFNWDGVQLNGEMAETGLYVIYLHLFNTNGNFKTFKKVIPLVRK